MKKKYEKAELEIFEFETDDVITSSGHTPVEDELPGVDPFA